MNSSTTFSLQTFLLGQSAENVVLRLTLILLVLFFIWIILLILWLVFLRQKNEKRSTQSRLYNPVEMTRRIDFERHHRMNSSSTSIASRKWYSFYRRFPSFRTNSSPAPTHKQLETHSSENSAKIQAVIEAMSRPSRTSSQRSVTTRRNSFSPPELRPEPPPVVQREISIETRPRAMSVARTTNGFLQNLTRRLSTQIPSFTSTRSRPPILRLTSSPSRTVEPFPLHWSSPGPHHRSRNLDFEASQRPLPLVMITDTNCSFTNIVELDSFEDEDRVLTDVERRLKQQLKTYYRPRFST